MSTRGSWIVLLSHPAAGAGCEISGEGGTSTGQNSSPGGMSYDSRPGGMSENFHPGGMSDATGRKGDVCVSKGEEATWHFLGRIPQQSYLNFFKGNISWPIYFSKRTHKNINNQCCQNCFNICFFYVNICIIITKTSTLCILFYHDFRILSIWVASKSRHTRKSLFSLKHYTTPK